MGGGFVEDFGQVLDAHGAAALDQAAFELQQTARIGRDDDGGRWRQSVVELALLKLARLNRVGDVVDTCAAAAQARLVDLGKHDARNSP